MRKLLAASLIALAVSASANAQAPDNPVKNAPTCVTVDYIRQRLAAGALEERAYLTGERAAPLLRAGNAPPASAAVLVLRVVGQPARLVIVVFNEEGRQVGMGAGPADAIERLIAPPGGEA